MESKLLKRILSFAIVVVMVMSMLPTTVFAAEDEERRAACPHCNNAPVDQWEPWSGGKLTEGHYYVQSDKVELLETISITEDVVIDLNGNTIHAPDDDRAFLISGGKLTILDSSEATAGNGTGTIQGGENGIASGKGAVIYMESGDNSRFYMYGGTLTGGRITGDGASHTGANYSQSAGESYFYGGTISGGNAAGRGGNISANGGKVHLFGKVEVRDGTAGTWGGNIYLTGNAELYIADDATITGGSGSKGANICAVTCTVYIFGGEIEDPKTGSADQDDIELDNPNAKLYMYGGTVGTLKRTNGSVNVYGGKIKSNPGEWLGTCGSASFATPEDNSTGYYQVTHTTATTEQPTCTEAGFMGYSCDKCPVTARLPLAAKGHAYQEIPEGKYRCSDCQDEITAIWCSHCEDDFLWKDWDGKSNIKQTSHYRLTKSDTLDQTIEVSEGVKMCIDLNGNTVQAPAADRAFHISGGGKLTIMDSSEDADGSGTGTIQGGENGISNGKDGGVIYMEGEASRFYMYGGTLTGGKITTTNATGANYSQNSGESYFYGGTISDGKNEVYRGGNIAVNGGGKIYLLGDVKVLNGESGTWGGNVFVTGDGTQLHIAEDALITGGISGTQQGANIHAEDASGVYIFGGKIEGFDKAAANDMSCDIQIGRVETIEGNLYMYGGTVGTIKKANKNVNIYIYNGNIKSNPADWTADCADYCLEDGVYKVWHIAGETCEDHAAELAKADALNAAIPHNYSEATCTTPKTCTKCNQTLGDVDSDAHNYGDWSNAGDGTHKKVCANGCGKDIVEAHKYEYTIDGANHKKVCVYGCGEDIVEAHKYEYTTDGNGKCECGATIVCEHSDKESSVSKEPTCTEKGEMTYNCPTCKKVWTEELAPKGHDYKSTVFGPDFDVEGYTYHECSLCGDNYEDNFVAAKVAVAIANGTQYESLEEALAQGGNVTLLAGVTVTETLKIEKDTDLDLGTFTVTANCNKAFEVYADATISNGTIIARECCVETCKKEILTLNNVDLKATEYYSANQQPLTIGGSENGTTIVNLNDVNIDAGTQGYAIISFVKTDLTIAKSDISGYMALYIQGAADIEITNSVLTSDITGNDVAGGATSAIVVEADNVSINMDGGKLETIGNNQTAIELRDVTGAEIVINSEIIAPSILSATEIEGNTVTVKAEYADELAADGYASRTAPTDGMITAVKAVADVNGNKYEFFTVAWADVNANGGNVTLLDNVTVTEPLTVDVTVTLDLNSHTLTGTLTLANEAAILNAAEGLAVISGMADMKVYYEDGTYELVAIDAVAYNEATGVFYVSVAKALSAATSGQTVKQIANDSVEMQIVRSGVTLDLHGNTLTADYLVAASKGANIIDSTDGKGSVVVTDDGSLDLRVDNESLVLKDGDTYTFVRSVVEHDWFKANESAWDEDPKDGNVHVKFALATDNNALHTLLATDGGKSENIVVRVRISWTDANGESWEKYYVYADTALMQYAANFRSEHLYLNITGADIAETLTVTAELVKLDDEGKVVFCTEDVLMSYSAAE